MIIVDNSVLVSAIVDTNKSALARKVTSRDEIWILPPLWKFEFTNVVATLVKSRNLDERAGRSALDQASAIVAGREVPVDQLHVLHMSLIHSISGYDAQYIALAEMYGARCVTDDKQLSRRVPDLTILLEELSKD